MAVRGRDNGRAEWNRILADVQIAIGTPAGPTRALGKHALFGLGLYRARPRRVRRLCKHRCLPTPCLAFVNISISIPHSAPTPFRTDTLFYTTHTTLSKLHPIDVRLYLRLGYRNNSPRGKRSRQHQSV